MIKKSGWWLPGKDTYFARFLEGDGGKKNGFQREHLYEALKYVENFGTAVDIGAHVGFWAWDMGHRFKHVHCFEPAPDCYECLVKNLEEYPNAITYNVAVGDRDGECELIDDPRRIQKAGANTGARYVNPTGRGTKMIKIDDLNLEACDFLKVDVEGFEYQVLLGARRTIARFRPVIIMETSKRFASRFGVSNHAAVNFLKDKKRDYELKVIMRPDSVYVPTKR